MQDESLPGAQLRRAREEKGLSREDVARDLRLSTAYFRALEEDDYDKLPEPPFIKGYLRNYARLLGLSGEEYASQFQQYVDRERAHVEEHNAAEEHNRPVFARQWRLPVLALLVVVLVIALGWWLWPSHKAVPPVADNPQAQVQQHDGASAAGAGRQQQADAGAMADATAPATGPTDQGTVPGDEAGQGAPVSGQAASAGTAPAQAPHIAAAAPETANSAPDSPSAVAGGTSLAMKFSRVCWVKVVDNAGKTLTEGRQEAGSAVSVDGKAPFRVTIGDAGAVSSVVINGKPTTLPSQRSGDVLHVTLP